MIELTIKLEPTNGNVEVTGPIDNKGLCYHMLEMARDAIKDFGDSKKKSGIVPVRADAIQLLKS